MALEGSPLPAQRFQAKLFTGATVESDLNTWFATSAGHLVDLLLDHDGTNPVVLVLYRPYS